MCTGGVCAGTAYGCTATSCQTVSTCNGDGGCNVVDKAAGTSCPDDGNPCTSDVCDGSGNCTHPAVTNGTSCGSGLVCVGTVCTPTYPALVLQKSAPPTVDAGACVTLPYTIDVTNTGNATAAAPVVTDVLPEGVIFVSATTTSGSCSFDAATNTVTCTLDDLPLNATDTVTIDTTTLLPTGSITNTASVSTSTEQSSTTGDTDSVTTEIVPATLSSWESISSNFNGTPIAAGDTLWFTAVAKVSGLPSNETASIWALGGTIAFSADNTSYSIPVPAAEVSFVPGTTTATTTFDEATDEWITVAPPSFSGNVFVAAVAVPLPAGLPGGINPVNWSTEFVSNTSGVSVNWQWATAVYTSFNTNYDLLEVKPIDDNHYSAIGGSDDAGTPEAYKQYVTGGARGGGGGNYTGSLSATAGGTPAVQCSGSSSSTSSSSSSSSSSSASSSGSGGCTSNCADGSPCTSNNECGSQQCNNGVCVAPGCASGNGACPDGQHCGANADCGSQICTNGTCAAPACSPSCADGTRCGSNSDCENGQCNNGVCEPSCATQTQKCQDGQACGASSECGSGVCSSGKCAAPACGPDCANGSPCGSNNDCGSQQCSNTGLCVSPGCASGNGACNDGQHCGANTDCGSENCVSGTCEPPTCAPSCATGSPCGNNSDCKSNHCNNGVCQ